MDDNQFGQTGLFFSELCLVRTAVEGGVDVTPIFHPVTADDITLDGSREMWTQAKWLDFVPRLERWMSFCEETGRRHGLQAASGFLLGGEAPGRADVVTATWWSTMADRFRRNLRR